MHFSITVSSWKYGFTNNFFSICASGFSLSFFWCAMCHLRLTVIDRIIQVTFSVNPLFSLVHERWEGRGRKRMRYFVLVPLMIKFQTSVRTVSFTVTALHRWPVLHGSSSLSGFYKIIHLFASSVLGMVLPSCMLLLVSRKFYWFLNPNTNVNSNFIKISSVESCEWNLFSIKNI